MIDWIGKWIGISNLYSDLYSIIVIWEILP